MAVVLTENAAQHISAMLQKRGSGIGLRLGMRKSGCSGFAYVVDYVDVIGNKDTVFESQGVKVVVDRDSLEQLDGTEVDYLRNNAINQGLEFRNPNVRDTCGCGESFSV